MKVLHITTSDKGGAGIAALQLHQALIQSGVVSAFLSSNLTIDFDNKIVEDTFFKYNKPSLLKKIRIKLENYFFSSERKQSIHYFDHSKEKLKFEMASLPFSSFQLQNHPLVQEADIINLHWIVGILDYPSFFKDCQKPIVWTLHDMNPFQGLFHYKNEKLLNTKISADFDDKMRQIKATAMQQIKKGVLIAPSKWLLREATNCTFFSSFIKECIPNSIDLDVFRPQDKIALRQEYSLGSDDFIILFVSDSMKNHRKGFDLLLGALLYLENLPLTVVTIGKNEMPIVGKIKIIPLGAITNAAEMAKCYSLADVFVLPSREDNLPNVMLEAFACGTPVIGFSVGGIKEHVKLNNTGVLADEISSLSLAKAIQFFYETKGNYKIGVIRNYAADNFNPEKQASAYQKVYDKILVSNKQIL
jgi:glycosyltransferase involved in cell wall biosynthesis